MQFVLGCLTVFICVLSISNAAKDIKQSNDTVNNGSGQENIKYFLPDSNVQDLSTAPTIMSKSRTSKSSAYLLTWKPGSKLTSVKFYKIRYRKDSSPLWKYATVPAHSTSLRLNDLEGSSLYEVEMIEVLLNDRSSMLASSSFRTGISKPQLPEKSVFNSSFGFPTPDDPHFSDKKRSNKFSRRNSNSTRNAQVPGAPSLPFVTDTSPTSVSLTWRPRSNGGSPITGYKIQIRPLAHGKRGWKSRREILLPADTRTYNINGLKRGAWYKFRVIAVNAVGESAPSQSTRPHNTDSFARKEPVIAPRITDVLMNNGSLIIHWQYDDVDPASYDGFLLKYHTKEKQGRKRIRDPSTSSHVIAKPLYGRVYSVKLQSYNSVGKSPESHTTRFRIIKNKVNNVDEVVFETPVGMPINPNDDFSYGDHFNADDKSPNSPPVHNEDVKAISMRKDIGLVIGGIATAFVIIVVVVVTKLCRKKSAQQQKSEKASSLQNETKENSDLCTKIVSYLCCRSKPRSAKRPQAPSPPPARCSCYSGASSPPQMGGSCVQSNRTSMSHSIVPDSGPVPCAPVRPSPTYAVYYDYSPGRPPPCCTPPGIPLWWVRGADGEFCHIVPHSARPKANELVIKTIEEQSEDAGVSPPTSRNASDVELDADSHLESEQEQPESGSKTKGENVS